MSITLTKIEAVRYRVEIPEELHKYGKDKIFPFLRGVSKVFHGWFQSRRLKSIKGKQCIFNDNTPDLYGTENGKLPKNRSLDDGRIKKVPEIAALINEYFPGDEEEIWGTGICSLVFQVQNRYAGYHKRYWKTKLKEFKKKGYTFVFPVQYIKFNPKAVAWKSPSFHPNPQEGAIDFRLLEGLRKDVRTITLNVEKDVYDNSHLLKLDKKGKPLKRGGNIVFKKKSGLNEIVLPVTREFTVEPQEKWLSLDINKTPLNWIALPEANEYGVRLIPRPPHIVQHERKVAEYNKLTSSKKFKKIYNHSQREGIRRKWKKAHAQYETMIEREVKPHLEYFLKLYPKHGWAIDTVKTGDRNGTFGQDKLPQIVARFCMKHELPFYFVSTPYTSQRCSKCGHISDEARDRDTNIYTCVSPSCGHREHGDLIASESIVTYGLALQDAGFPMVAQEQKDGSPYANSMKSFLRDYFGHPK